MNSSADSQPPPNPSGVVTLTIKGLGHVPALKNSFFRIVQKEVREWKLNCVKSFASQLLSGTATTESGTPTPLSRQSLIALLPQDDNWKILPHIQLDSIKVNPGEEGAEIII
jgi:hypothetical protein